MSIKVSPLVMPTAPNAIRHDAYMHSNGHSIMNASVMYYGGAKTGKTRLIIKAFSGADYIFLDLDRNYESTINEITKSGARYFNGSNAIEILYQLMDGKGKNEVVIIDALGSIVKLLCRKFIKQHTGKDDKLDEVGIAISEAEKGIGVNHADTVTFFNHIIEPMTRNSNSINFIHHTTQNKMGEKMEGNQGAWLSVFDFTYEMNRETKTFVLKAGRLPIAPNSIGVDNIYDRINKTLIDNQESTEVSGKQKMLTPYKKFSDNHAMRMTLNPLVKNGTVKKVKVGRKEYLESELVITAKGQCEENEFNNFIPLYSPTLSLVEPKLDDQS